MLGGKPHSLPIARGWFAPFVPAILSVPLAFLFVGIQLFGLGIQGDPLVFIIGLIALGLLTTLDLRHGLTRVIEGFGVSFLASLYVIGHSPIESGASPSFVDWSTIPVALPLSLGVLVAGLLFSSTTKYKIIKTNVLASVALTIGLAIGPAVKTGPGSTAGSAFLTPFYFLALAVPANIAQMVLLHFLNRLWRARSFSLTMMPTAFFAYNLLNFVGYLNSQDLNQLFPFLSSFVFLPALALAGVTSGTIAQKMARTPTIVGPKIGLTGETLVRLGRDQIVKIATEIGGRPKNMANIDVTVARQGGKTERMRLSKLSRGAYKATYRPQTPGTYTVNVNVTSNNQQTADKSFSFTVQPSPSQHSQPHSPPPPPSRPPPAATPPLQSRPTPPPAPLPPQPALPPAKLNLPGLNNWDPRVWVNQELHGYKIKEYLATGLTGYVLRASFEHGGNEMAIKIPILKPGTGATALDETMSEATRLLELSQQSKYVVQLRGILVDRLNVQEILKGDTALYLKSPPAIVMELMKGGAAKTLVEDPSYDSLYYSEKWGGIVVLIGTMIATALETIHNAGFVHLDVKPQNILFNVKPPVTGREATDQIRNGTLVPKLADLGSAVRIGGKVSQFTSEYAAGEQVLGDGAATAMDIYALGATMYSLLTKTPANSKRLIDAMNNTTQNPGSGKVLNDLRSVWNSFVPDFTRVKFPSAIPIMKKMLGGDPKDRPSAGSVVSSLRNLV